MGALRIAFERRESSHFSVVRQLRPLLCQLSHVAGRQFEKFDVLGCHEAVGELRGPTFRYFVRSLCAALSTWDMRLLTSSICAASSSSPFANCLLICRWSDILNRLTCFVGRTTLSALEHGTRLPCPHTQGGAVLDTARGEAWMIIVAGLSGAAFSALPVLSAEVRQPAGHLRTIV